MFLFLFKLCIFSLQIPEYREEPESLYVFFVVKLGPRPKLKMSVWPKAEDWGNIVHSGGYGDGGNRA